MTSEVVPLPSGERGQWYLLDCGRGFYEGAAGPGVPSDVPLWAGLGTGTELAKAVDPKVLAEKAVSSLDLPKPEVRLSPGAQGPQVVRVPTWLWVESRQWKPVQATAEVPGVSVVAVASPASVTWAMGDGSTVECKGAGTPYSATFDAASPSPDCGYTYLRPSAGRPDGALTVSVTVHWSVSWSGAGQGGTYPDLATTSELTVRAVEVQSLVTK
ncbi:hypothetical protein [Kitasatospora sp. NPDC001175]|uniref:hypothetical protein n=1 Tax=Kitasatospora sp. NPDC001175 TaxID=3157103 RepID=UPI003D01305C